MDHKTDEVVVTEEKRAEAELLVEMQEGQSGNDEDCHIAEKW
jgi:hypothetical protein